NWHDKHLFKIVEPMTIRHLPAVHVQDLPRLVTSYVTVRCGSRLLFNELVHRCTQASATFKPDALASLVAAFSKSPHKPKVFSIVLGLIYQQEYLPSILVAQAQRSPSFLAVSVDENSPGEVVNIAELFKGKKGVLFALPGAFTPMKAWEKQQETEGKLPVEAMLGSTRSKRVVGGSPGRRRRLLTPLPGALSFGPEWEGCGVNGS
ncbi:unnamed protein product, partial [Polarella glacialis]